MKQKYHGLLSISLIFIAVIFTVLYSLSTSWERIDEVRISRLKSSPDITVPEPAVIIEIGQLEKRMKSLVYPPISEPTAVNLILFGYQPMERPRITFRGRQTTMPVRVDYSLTFAFSSNKKRFCIIDGSFYSEGSDLPGGGKILKIESNRVLVRKERFSIWIPLDNKGAENGNKRITKTKT